MTRLAAAFLALASSQALAHPGHGQQEGHLHASPEFLLLAAVVAVIAILRSR